MRRREREREREERKGVRRRGNMVGGGGSFDCYLLGEYESEVVRR